MTNSDGNPVVYLIGTCGYPNYGDELIVASWLRLLAKRLPNAEVWVDSARPGQSAVLLSHLHPNVRFVDSLYHACWNAPSEDPAAVIAFGEHVIAEPGLVPREATGIENLEHVDLVHVVGGSYINALWPRNLVLLSAAASMARRFGTRTALTGSSLTPLVEGSDEALTTMLSDFDVVDVRDSASFDVLAPAVKQVTNTGDDVFLDLEPDLFDLQAKTKTLVAIQPDMLTVPLEQVADYVVRTLKDWGADQTPVTVLECLPPDDTAIVPLLEAQLPKVGVLPFSLMWRHGFPAAPRSRWITTRFHPHLMGAASGAWGVVLPTGGDSLTTSGQTLIDEGSGWTMAPDLETVVPSSRRTTGPFGGALPKLQADKRSVAEAVLDLVNAAND